MNNKLFSAMAEVDNDAKTWNGAKAYRTSLSALVDLFSKGASFRNTPERIRPLVRASYLEDKIDTVRVLFYFRDIREGQGERAIFREGLRELLELDPHNVKRVLHYIPEYGRWDDLISLWGITKETNLVIAKIIGEQLERDIVAYESNDIKNISLLAKWMPSSNTSSAKTRQLANEIRTKVFAVDERTYRKTLAMLRKALKIVETNLSKKDYSFDYSKLPGKAMMQYRKAFLRNDKNRYEKYLYDLQSAIKTNDKSVKINANTLYPYELVERCLGLPDNYHAASEQEESLCDSAWRSLKDYFEGNTANWLAVSDVSGSMRINNCRPLSVSISLGLYIGEHNKGIFKNKFITFDSKPQLVEFDSSWPLHKKIEAMEYIIGYNTDLKLVFDLILAAAKAHNLAQSDMPEAIVIISDMQFDSDQLHNTDVTSFEYIRCSYEEAGYKMPKLVYWNVAAQDTGNLPVTINDRGVVIANGCKPGMFDIILQAKSPYDFVQKVINSDRYHMINF